jgi:hypothetical protein
VGEHALAHDHVREPIVLRDPHLHHLKCAPGRCVARRSVIRLTSLLDAAERGEKGARGGIVYEWSPRVRCALGRWASGGAAHQGEGHCLGADATKGVARRETPRRCSWTQRSTKDQLQPLRTNGEFSWVG